MQNNNRKIFDSLISKTKVYLVVIFILLVVICILEPQMIIPAIIIFMLILGYAYLTDNKRKNELSQHLQDLTVNVNTTAKNSLIHSPFPLVIAQMDGSIIWKSAAFTSEFEGIEIGPYIKKILEKIKSDKDEEQTANSINEEITIGSKDYKIIGETAKTKKADKRKQNNKKMITLYFIDRTAENKLRKEYIDSKSCVGIIMIDNYEETMLQINTEERPQVTAQIEKAINDWANKIDGLLIKSDRDRYIYIFEHRYLENIRTEKFSILDTIKDISIVGKVQITLSIVISDDGNTDKERYKTAQDGMDVVLGRGGDQAAIVEMGKYQFFGGKPTEVEKRTKVKARIVSHALEGLISESEQVMIMGHANPDIDALGSALGIYRLAKTLGKTAYIVASTEGMALKEVLMSLDEEEQYKNVIINKEIAENQITSDTLLVIVDTHKINYVEAPELLEKTNKIAIIDHHRRSTDFIKNSILTFHESYASSAAELVTELLQYADSGPILTKIEAEALYAGIMMDTKSFTFKTGVRTFEAAAYLRRYGVDIIKVKKWFQNDLETYKKIMEIVERTEIYKDSIGIATYENESKDTSIICAKTADELLSIGNIAASFVIGKFGENISISGRSIGDINVQLILEKLGGGGHGTVAGAQMQNKEIDEVKEELINKIDEYFAETDNS